MSSNKILTSKQEIMTYLGDCSDYLFKKYISLGMPARYADKRWIAHVDNLEDWFKKYTFISMKKMQGKFPPENPVK